MKTGDKVVWSSQASGVWKEKSGEIVAVVPAKRSAAAAFKALPNRQEFRKPSEFSTPRPEESYLVAVPPESGVGKPKIYWPKTSQLALVEEEEATGAVDSDEAVEDHEDEHGVLEDDGEEDEDGGEAEEGTREAAE